VSSRLGLGWLEGELEIQAAELGLHLGGIRLQQPRQVLQLLADPAGELGQLLAGGLLVPLPQLALEALDRGFPVGDRLQQSRRRTRATLDGGDKVLELPAFLLQLSLGVVCAFLWGG